MAQVDLNPYFDDLLTWNDYIDSLSDDPLETIMTELMRIGIAKDHWRAYLRCLALEMPGCQACSTGAHVIQTMKVWKNRLK
jgi:uncharacterized protein YbcC (UPF0753/DUF2309 family)